MAQFWLDLTRPAGTVEAEFSIFEETPQGTTLQLVDDAGTPAMYLISSAPNDDYTSGIWDKGTAPFISGDCQVLAKCRFPLGSTNTYRRGPGRGQTNNNGYASEITSSSVGQRITRYTGTSGSTLASNASTINDARLYHWRLMEISGTTIKTVAWDGEYADKPVAWDNEVTDATYTDGFAYFVDRATSSRNGSYYALLSVGTNGDPAPDTPPVVGGPTIDTQPQPQTVTEPDAATFTVVATTSGGALSYQWKDDGVNVGTNSATYNTGATTVSMDGSLITVDVTDDNGTTTSNTALLTVNAAVTTPGIFPDDVAITGLYADDAPITAVYKDDVLIWEP